MFNNSSRSERPREQGEMIFSATWKVSWNAVSAKKVSENQIHKAMIQSIFI